jgi:hypothetical protein
MHPNIHVFDQNGTGTDVVARIDQMEALVSIRRCPCCEKQNLVRHKNKQSTWANEINEAKRLLENQLKTKSAQKNLHA